MLKRVLITGGSGFIGQHTLKLLLARDYEVHMVSSRKREPLAKDVIIHQANLLDCHSHASLIKNIQPTHLLQNAWYTENGKFWDAVENVYWLKATISLAETFYEAGGQRLLGVGTCAEYDWTDGLCSEGKTPENPTSLYGKTKKSAHDCLQALANYYKGSFSWARIFFPYGPGEPQQRLIPYVITRLLQGEHAHCTHGKQVRDFLHVNDIGNALAAVLDADITGAVNIGSGNPVTLYDIVTKIAKTLSREDLIKFGSIQEPAHSPAKILADVTRLKNEIGWTPKISLEEGLLSTIHWWQNSNLIGGEK